MKFFYFDGWDKTGELFKHHFGGDYFADHRRDSDKEITLHYRVFLHPVV